MKAVPSLVLLSTQIKPFDCFDDSVNGCQSEPGAFTSLLSGEEWFEDVLLGFIIHSDSIVANRELNIRAFRLGFVFESVLIDVEV